MHHDDDTHGNSWASSSSFLRLLASHESRSHHSWQQSIDLQIDHLISCIMALTVVLQYLLGVDVGISVRSI
jgi:hypothetical protein